MSRLVGLIRLSTAWPQVSLDVELGPRVIASQATPVPTPKRSSHARAKASRAVHPRALRNVTHSPAVLARAVPHSAIRFGPLQIDPPPFVPQGRHPTKEAMARGRIRTTNGLANRCPTLRRRRASRHVTADCTSRDRLPSARPDSSSQPIAVSHSKLAITYRLIEPEYSRAAKREHGQPISVADKFEPSNVPPYA